MRRVVFCVRCNDTRMGLHVRVVGGSSLLGTWNPADAVPLSTSALEFPTWRMHGATQSGRTPSKSTLSGSPGSVGLSLPDDEVVEYKYVICDNSGRPVKWEDRPNRKIHLADLVARGVCTEVSSVITVMENWNTADEPEELRFQSSSAGLSSSGILRVRSNSFSHLRSEVSFDKCSSEEAANGSSPPDHFYPTIRERHPVAVAANGAVEPAAGGTEVPLPRASQSLSMLQLAEEESAADSKDPTPVAEPGECAEGFLGPASQRNGGMMREESSSNLFMEMELHEAPEPLEFEDHYTLIGSGPLGEGTFGLVWRCAPKDEEDTAEERAAKIVRKARLKPHEMTYLLGEGGEVKVHVAMKHPHVVELFQYFDEAHTVTMVLEYCRGGDLFDAVVKAAKATNRGLEEKGAAVATKHVLLALAYVHSQRVVHRDIKCENILLARAGVPVEENTFKLCDFGFAKYDEGCGLNDRLGSPDTVAPEIVCGKTYSTPADLWSVGVLVYMMLGARPPFTASSDGEVLKKVRAGNYSFCAALWDCVSDSAKNLIVSLMQVDAAIRLSAEQALDHEWLKEALA
eukprot:TRINITY_DN7333_c0_g2_i1.p1 TRINITY_DN7333_c0_g2~~TRINITY_DN7333_c0_g2_i1.p1  ORF type:complete len:572 (+),score=111.92 TRINITY_DN7333_c0_g2_i1:139-1854(+)